MKKRIDIKVGFRCNNECRFCVQAHKKGIHADRSFEELEQILREAKEQYDSVVFTGGEVSIRPDAADLVSLARDLGYASIHLQSNGRMFAYKSVCKRMIEAGATEFGFSLHGHKPDLHEYLTCGKDSFKQSLKGMSNLAAMGQTVLSNTVITKSNYRHLPEIAELLVGIGVSQYQFAFVHILGNAAKYALSIVPRKTLIKPYLCRGLDIGNERGVQAMAEAVPLCFMRGYAGNIAEFRIPDTKIFEADYTIENFTVTRQISGKTKGPPCEKCAVNCFCEGPWKEYPDLFGWAEFEPLDTMRASDSAYYAVVSGKTN